MVVVVAGMVRDARFRVRVVIRGFEIRGFL